MTQYLTNPPTAISALATMLDLCAGYAMDTYYPEAPSNTSGTFAIISPIDERRTRYAEGATSIPSGSLLLTLYRDTTIGTLEAQAMLVQKQVTSLATGLLLRGATVGRCAEAGPSLNAGGHTRKAIDITIEYGLNA
jgi:hypothetical protein